MSIFIAKILGKYEFSEYKSGQSLDNGSGLLITFTENSKPQVFELENIKNALEQQQRGQYGFYFGGGGDRVYLYLRYIPESDKRKVIKVEIESYFS